MKRALQLAKNGEGRVSPNPMVGAVIAYGDRIIGEGFHAFYGGPHAEVNAINSIKKEDLNLLKDSTLYVTLEPCAHYGKTPPCAELIVNKEIPKVVVGTLDPNPLVAGKGIEILKKAGVEVFVGTLEKKCRNLNEKFITSHEKQRPWITLKWAESADGYMASIDDDGRPEAVKFSSPLSLVWMHRERSNHDAVLVGHNTEKLDHPLLNVRYWGGNSGKKIVAQGKVNLKEFLKDLWKEKISSILVEGGPTLLNDFIKNDLYDQIRIEKTQKILAKGLKSPQIEKKTLLSSEHCRENVIERYRS